MSKVYGRGRLTPEDHERIYEMESRGFSAGAIAREIKKAPSTVQWFMYSHGLRAPQQRDEAVTFQRGGRLVRRFTRAEDTFIEALRAKGEKHSAIAERANAQFHTERKPHSIKCRLIMLAAIESSEDFAEEVA